MRRKMPFTFFKCLFSFQRYSSFKICKLPSDDFIYSTKFWSGMMKNDISANLFDFCSKVLLKVQHNMSLKVLLPWQHTGLHFCTPSAFHFHICKWRLAWMIQQAYKYVSSSSWPCLAFFELKITNSLKSSGWGLEQSELPWEQNFYSHRCFL